MAFKHILVPLFGYDADRTALDAALTLAKRGGAHISARHIKVDPMESVPLMVDVGVAATELIEAVERHAATRGKAAAATFEAWRNERDLKIDDQPSLRTGITTAFSTSCSSIHFSRSAAVSSRVWFQHWPMWVCMSMYGPAGAGAPEAPRAPTTATAAAAAQNVRRLTSLSPVLGGEGRGEGRI